MAPHDDLGGPVPRPAQVRRVVSLVPSLTEAMASVDCTALVGVTDWCTHPGDLDTTRVRGTKNPDTNAIVALAPDLVVANKEETRELDGRRLRDAGVPVWVTAIETRAATDRLDGAAVRRGPWLACSPTASAGPSRWRPAGRGNLTPRPRPRVQSLDPPPGAVHRCASGAASPPTHWRCGRHAQTHRHPSQRPPTRPRRRPDGAWGAHATIPNRTALRHIGATGAIPLCRARTAWLIL
jgi:hypothetical protein